MFFADQIIGSRELQEDTFLIGNAKEAHSNGAETIQVFVVADGMGGHAGGGIASRLAAEAFMRCIQSINAKQEIAQSLLSALNAADMAIGEKIVQDSRLSGMGTTVLGVMRRANSLEWISAGDSPLLLFRGSNLQRLNEDHSMLPVLMEAAEANGQSKDAALIDPRRHQLRSVLKGRSLQLVDAGALELHPNDIVLIASDGLDTLDMGEIGAVLNEDCEAPPEVLVTNIIACISEREVPHQDNVTLIVYRHN